MRRQPPPGPPPGPDESLDQLYGDWWIYQLARGHRFSTDDVLTAWRASIALPHARRCLDLGCGVGSVGLSTLGLLGWPDATLVGVEAQEQSAALARRSVSRNGLDQRVRILSGDLRDPDVLPAEDRFELVTGSPPYMPTSNGIVSSHPQRAACRFELRGSCVDYCLAARRWLAPGGRFVFVMLAADPRIEQGPRLAGLAVLEQFDVVFREGVAPLISVMTCARQEDGPFGERVRAGITVRRTDGALTAEYAALRAHLGFDPLD